MNTIILRPAEPERDFGRLAAWFTLIEDEPTTESGLKEYYDKHKTRIFQMAAENEQGELLGFYWAARDRIVPERMFISLFVAPEQRDQGVGSRLYDDLAHVVAEAQVKNLRISVRDTCPEGRTFAERRGFSERSHRLALAMDLKAFDDRPYAETIARLQANGFRFTSMEELGDTEEAQRMLYRLNDATSMDTPGSDGEHYWESFEDFQTRVCRSDWYIPGGQMVAIDSATGIWAALSAITRLEGNDYAYNLHTGVDRAYHGRKLGQAIKVQALRYARDVLQAISVRTHTNSKNLPMIAINRKFGYTELPGEFILGKKLIGS